MSQLSTFAAQLPQLSQLDAGALLERVRATWPQVVFEPERFGAWLRERLGTARVGERHVADLYLAWGVLEGQAAAVRTFDQLLTTWATLALRNRPAGVEVDEVLSHLRTRLLVDAPQRASALRQYTGQGALKAYVIVAALRALTDQLRAQPAAQPHDALELAEHLAHDGRDAESRLRVAQLSPHLRAALERALAALPVRLRTVLRLHYVDGVPAEVLARLYGVHRATTTRWLVEARQQVLEATHAHLGAVLGPETLSSVKRELSAFELSLPGLFTELPEP